MREKSVGVTSPSTQVSRARSARITAGCACPRRGLASYCICSGHRRKRRDSAFLPKCSRMEDKRLGVLGQIVLMEGGERGISEKRSFRSPRGQIERAVPVLAGLAVTGGVLSAAVTCYKAVDLRIWPARPLVQSLARLYAGAKIFLPATSRLTIPLVLLCTSLVWSSLSCRNLASRDPYQSHACRMSSHQGAEDGPTAISGEPTASARSLPPLGDPHDAAEIPPPLSIPPQPRPYTVATSNGVSHCLWSLG